MYAAVNVQESKTFHTHVCFLSLFSLLFPVNFQNLSVSYKHIIDYRQKCLLHSIKVGKTLLPIKQTLNNTESANVYEGVYLCMQMCMYVCEFMHVYVSVFLLSAEFLSVLINKNLDSRAKIS